MEQRGDGSACQGGGQTACKLFSNPNLPLCSSVSAHGTQLVECAAGSYGSYFTAKDTTQDNTCTSCGDNECKEGLNAETACTQHTALKCGAGEYFNATDKTHDNTCFECGDNTYKEGLNDETSCTPKTLECAAGSCFTAVTATDKKQDNTCTSCGDNEYKEGLNAETSCTQHAALKCGAGEYFNATDKTQDNTCFACGDNTYKEGLNDETSCTPKTLECACVCVCWTMHRPQ